MNEVHSAYSASASAVSGIKEVIQLTHCPSGRLSLSLSLPVCVLVPLCLFVQQQQPAKLIFTKTLVPDSN